MTAYSAKTTADSVTYYNSIKDNPNISDREKNAARFDVAVGMFGTAAGAAGTVVSARGTIRASGGNVRSTAGNVDNMQNRVPNNEITQPNKRGNAPISNKDGKPIEIHHNEQAPSGPFNEMHPSDHRYGDNYKNNHPNYNKKSQIDRRQFREWKQQYWEQEWDNGRWDN